MRNDVYSHDARYPRNCMQAAVMLSLMRLIKLASKQALFRPATAARRTGASARVGRLFFEPVVLLGPLVQTYQEGVLLRIDRDELRALSVAVQRSFKQQKLERTVELCCRAATFEHVGVVRNLTHWPIGARDPPLVLQ